MPKILKIVLHPDPRLHQPSDEVPLEKLAEEEFQQLLLDMEETMRKKDGAGLAAPQIGRNIRAIVVASENGQETLFMINPRITKRSWARVTEDEGCLSVLNEKGEIVYAPVERYKKVNCIYLDRQGRQKKISAEQMLARVIQHEIDHIDGILFLDRVAEQKKKPKASS